MELDAIFSPHPARTQAAQAGRPGHGLGLRQDRGQGPQGPEGPLGGSTKRRLRGRADAAAAPAPEAGLQESASAWTYAVVNLGDLEALRGGQRRRRRRLLAQGRSGRPTQGRPVKILATANVDQGARRSQAHAFCRTGRGQDRAPAGGTVLRCCSLFDRAFANIFKIPGAAQADPLHPGLLAVYRIGSPCPTPGVDARALAQFFAADRRARSSAWSDLFSGGALEQLSIFALGIMPYIWRRSSCSC